MHQEILHSIRFQLAALLLLLFAVFAGASVYALQSAEQRQQEQAVVAVTAHLQLAASLMRQQALNYLSAPARDYPTYYRDVRLYFQDLLAHRATLDTHLGPDGDLRHRTGVLHADGNRAVEETARQWSRFREGLMDALGEEPDQPRLEWGAQYIIEHGEAVEAATRTLHQALEDIAEAGLAAHQRMIRVSVLAAILIMLGVVYWLHARILRPLEETSSGFRHVAQGDFGHQVPNHGRNEIGLMAQAFNSLSCRLLALFGLIDKVQQAEDPERMLTAIWPELRTLVPLDWAGLIMTSPDGAVAALEHAALGGRAILPANRHFPLEDSQLGTALAEHRPLRLAQIGPPAIAHQTHRLEDMLLHEGLHSALLIPIHTEHTGNPGLLVLAAYPPNAYQLTHLTLVTNLAGLIGHALRKTVIMENLVISAVEGLAKLAESRDPDTGEHLTRMRLYAGIVAEQLARDGKRGESITPRFTRDIYRFAPMHDIGKVGIPDHVLLKRGRLSAEERVLMDRHPVIGAEVLRQCEAQMERVGFDVFATAIEIAEGHHERYDGEGYPHGVRGENIPLAARIVAVADVFDALTSRRPYKPAWPVDRALDWMRQQAGSRFDPRVVAALVDSMPRILSVYERLKHV
jgi:HD-GYP domain-containing protein (c-di-GMP phosphodiesterase class II)/HAMP domain-containing protein